ncbi:MAG: xylose ABC transporter ATP-binding protein [Firmicutes bacterium]|nr:xylose ABC transporter ATP-binding protein [Bacillota bacterium]
MSGYILEMRNITKEFPGIKALDDVNLQVKPGEIHALCGENGAGKSTLMKILSGVHPYGTYQGEILINGEVKRFYRIKDSEQAGTAIIYQELALVKYMTVGENIFLGDEPAKNGVVNWNKVYAESRNLLAELNIDVNTYTKVINLGIGYQQMVEIAKALSKNARILILDEPTSALTESETEHLLNILRRLRDKGVTCIYISHKLEEVFKIADSITILRDGKTVCTDEAKNLTEDRVISLMVGRELTQRFPVAQHVPGDVVLEVKNFTLLDEEVPGGKKVDNVSFQARQGEILGIAGLMGAGRTELATAIFGAFTGKKEGEILVEGRQVTIDSPLDAINHGIAYLSEDRKRYGLVLMMDVQENIALPNYPAISRLGVINNNEKVKHAQRFTRELRIKTPSLAQRVANLSGGNQQKVVLAKWLMANPRVLIMDEPTRGIDVGAKFEIYNIMHDLVKQGVCVIMISSELPEILGMSDRILVMHEGKISGEFQREEADQEIIMSAMAGGNHYVA